MTKNIFPPQIYLGLVQAAPLPTLVGRVACCQLDLHAGCGTPQGRPQGPAAPLAGTPQGPLVADHHLRALIKPIDRLAGSATHANIFVIFVSKPNQ